MNDRWAAAVGPATARAPDRGPSASVPKLDAGLCRPRSEVRNGAALRPGPAWRASAYAAEKSSSRADVDWLASARGSSPAGAAARESAPSTKRSRRRFLVVTTILLLASPALAQPLGVTARVEQPMARTGGDDPTASATAVDARDRPTTLDTLDRALLQVPGARPLSSGAYGSPTSLSLRGADADQLQVMFGDVPITTADGSAFDLTTVPLWTLERVEVYRSGAPTWLGVGGIGGVLRLVPRSGSGPPSLGGTLGVGSFGLVHGRVAAHVSGRDLEWTAAAGVTSSQGNFPYRDDGRTVFDTSDDVTRNRQNAWVRSGAGLGHLRAHVAGGTLSVFLFGLGRLAGVPGPASQPTRYARRNEASLLGGMSFELTDRGRRPEDADWRLQIATSAGYRNRRFTDRFGEVGLVPRVTDDHQWRSVLRIAASGRPLSWLELTGVGLWTHEELDPHDALARTPNSPSARDAGTLALETRLHGRIGGVRVELRPSARFAVIGARLTEIRTARAGQSTRSLTLAPTFRIGAAIEPVRGLTVAASAASATRPPSMVELFGDRGYLVGDTTLKPEQANTFDLGVAMRGREGVVSGSAEVRGFVTLAHDLIRYRRTSLYTAVPENVASATLFGGELGLNGQVTRHFRVSGALTLLDTRTEYLGQIRRLPLRPWLTAYVRPSVSIFDLDVLSRLDLWIDLVHVSSSYVNPANDPGGLLAARTRFGVGISAFFFGDRVRLDVAMRDVFDQRGTDSSGLSAAGSVILGRPRAAHRLSALGGKSEWRGNVDAFAEKADRSHT